MTFARFSDAQVSLMLQAFGCEQFEIGMLRFNPNDWLRTAMTRRQIINNTAYLRRMNAGGWNINIEPRSSAWTVLDDLSKNQVGYMQRSGFEPAIVVMTSPNNCQAWMNHGRELQDADLSRMIAVDLAARFGGDRSCAASRHMGRLAGFRNRKEKYCRNGEYPKVELRAYTGKPYTRAGDYVAQMSATLENERHERAMRPVRKIAGESLRKTIEDYRRETPDTHVADFRYAMAALRYNTPEQDIIAAIKTRPDIHKKWTRYPEYTVQRAAKAIGR